MLKEVFSDYFAQRENYLTAIDARIKLFFVAAFIGLSLCASKVELSLSIAVLCFGFLMSVKIPLKVILLRLCAPFGAAIVVALLQVFFYGTTPFLKLSFLGFTFVGYLEGFLRGMLMLGRVTGAVSLLVFLSMTTPLNKLLSAAGYFKVPYTLIEITMLTYRYIFRILEDAVTIQNAQRMRLGYSNLSRGLRSIGEMAGAVVIKAYDQSLSIQEAMMLRGYKEKAIYEICSKERLAGRDYIAGVIFVAIFSLLFILDIYARQW